VTALSSNWGYGYWSGYSNPYYVAPVVSTQPAYDYSEPIVINNYNAPVAESSADATAASDAEDTPEVTQGYQLFDQAVEAFQGGRYQEARNLTNQSVALVPDDPVLHEFGALSSFALGEYEKAAAVLNSLLAVAPGMDWTSVASLYPDTSVYTQQLRALEEHCKENSKDAAAEFVLAYHYLICGHTESACNALRQVVKNEPSDAVARRMLEALTEPDEEAPAEEPAPPADDAAAASTTDDEEGPTTDLVGSWKAERDGNQFELTIDEEGDFVWQVTFPEGDPVKITGQYGMEGNVLLLESPDDGTMAARVVSGGADEFQFVLAGSPPDDDGLSFNRA
jgi:predicted Zn-dependent protease